MRQQIGMTVKNGKFVPMYETDSMVAGRVLAAIFQEQILRVFHVNEILKEECYEAVSERKDKGMR